MRRKVVLSTVGEAAADQFFQGYLLNATMPGLHAQAIGAALISIEREFLLFPNPQDSNT